MIYLVSIVLVFLQTFINGFNLPVLVVIFVASGEISSERAYLYAFITGLFADLVLGNRLGVLAGSYLIATLVVFIYKSRFRFNRFSLSLFLVISQLIFFYARGFIG